ncbi:CesT family type III secretion system chaperone [Dyella sp. M7H15-1]|uniref:type III secretion system chaperone n=1 Tax=Dyella sp. M7H15-1 TaxID=2501295 RepID=UPI00100500FF|nr:type III secretion system chaperone [Dyella sp. M7H15-1]QAU24766.1 CesT family type III secretion system chaperone [Dyella sp. M7H15-1]
MNKRIEGILGEFGKRVSLPDLAFDATGHCPLQFDEKIIVNLQIHASSGNLLMFSPVGVIGDDADPSLLRRLLNANVFWQETAGATLSVIGHDGTVMLAMQTPEDAMSLVSFEAQLDDFVKAVEYWSEQLSNEKAPAINHHQADKNDLSIHLTKRA